jgi:hypothetical protein
MDRDNHCSGYYRHYFLADQQVSAVAKIALLPV